jgi:hypothetical protein
VGLSRFELLTPRLSSVCSNQLSYRPKTLSDPCPDPRPVPEFVPPGTPRGAPFGHYQKERPREAGPILSKLDRT